jgi:hypothetical protein
MSSIKSVICSAFLLAVLVAGLLPTPSIAAGEPSGRSGRKLTKDERVMVPINLAILIQDDLVSHVSNELDITREFIQSLPKGSQVMVGYIGSGSLRVRQPFTTELGKAAASLRILVSSSTASPYNPYVEVLEALRRFEPRSTNRNVLLLISDGLDVSRGFDPASVLDSIDMQRAITEANRREVSIYSFYAPSVGLSSRNALFASYGQSSLDRISRKTGGKAFFQGITDFVTFDPYFARFTQALNRMETTE